MAKYCPKCGKEESDTQNYCNDCGLELKTKKSSWYYIAWAIAIILLFSFIVKPILFPAQSIDRIEPKYVINRSALPPSGFTLYVNTDLDFDLYVPDTWEARIADATALSALKSDPELAKASMPKTIGICKKGGDSIGDVLIIWGMDFTQSALGDFSLQSFNDGFIEGLKQEYSKDVLNVTVMSSKALMQNGYEGRTTVFSYTTKYGIPCTIKTTLIKNGPKLYILQYVGTNAEYSKNEMWIDAMANSFEPY